ncbi:MAG: hypothetical protein ACREAA_10175 [Candidatus Polarisedimenticolia bacterium]
MDPVPFSTQASFKNSSTTPAQIRGTDKVLCLALESEGYRVLEAPDGREGVARYGAHRPALAIVDKTVRGILVIDHAAGREEGASMRSEDGSQLMNSIRVVQNILDRFPDLRAASERIDKVMNWFGSLSFHSVEAGVTDVRQLSRSCRGLSNASLMRGADLFRMGVGSVNEGAILSAFVLLRASYETLAFLIFAQREIERRIDQKSPEALAKAVNKLTSGNKLMAKTSPSYPEPYHINEVLRGASRHIDNLLRGSPEGQNLLLSDYDFGSEFVHPNQPSFDIYQKLSKPDKQFNFSYELAMSFENLNYLLSAMAFIGRMTLVEGRRLAEVPDLPPTWPDS